MPIYDQGYQRWNGEMAKHPVRWWPILRRGVLEVVKQRKYLMLMLGAWIAPLVKGVELYFKSRANEVGVGQILPVNTDIGMSFFYDVFTSVASELAVLLFVVLVGSDLIARDRRHNALQMYFSKPLTRNDYIMGKLGVVAAFIVMVVWVPNIILWLFAISLRHGSSYFAAVWAAPFAGTAYTVLLIAVTGLLILALSSIGRRANLIAVSWLIIYGYGPLAGVVELLQGFTGHERWGLIRIKGNLDQVGAWMFGVRLPNDFHPILSTLVLAVVVGGCYWLVRRRIEPVEVVL